MLPNILLVDDDAEFREHLRAYLSNEVNHLEVTDNGESGLRLIEQLQPDIVILDVRMPVKDGLAVCREIREWERSTGQRIGIMMVSGERKEVIDRILGLELGADKYLIKPFLPAELLAEIKSLWRLLKPQTSSLDHWFRIDHNLKINFYKRLVIKNDQEINLTKLEFDVLKFLAQNANVPQTRSTLAQHVWQWDIQNSKGGENPINKCIAGLRKKIESDPGSPQYILTIHWVGYKLLAH